jgi:hypothetical protein
MLLLGEVPPYGLAQVFTGAIRPPHWQAIRTQAMGQRWPKAVTKRVLSVLSSGLLRASSGRGKDRILRLWQHLWIVQCVVQTSRFLAFHG